MEWAVNLGHIYIMYATTVLSQYRPATHKSHFSKIKHIYGYLKKYTSTSINFNTETPDYKDFKTIAVN